MRRKGGTGGKTIGRRERASALNINELTNGGRSGGLVIVLATS